MNCECWAVGDGPFVETLNEYLGWCFLNETPPRTKELAALMEIDRSTLHRRCMAALGEPPGTVLKRIQLDYAACLTRAGGMTQRTIAYRAAFGTRRTFYRARRRSSDAVQRALEVIATECP